MDILKYQIKASPIPWIQVACLASSKHEYADYLWVLVASICINNRLKYLTATEYL